MSTFVIGINHKTAPISLREKIYFSLDSLPLYLRDLLNQGLVEEAILLSTCNRSELYCETKLTSSKDIQAICDWFCAQSQTSREELNDALYIYSEKEAVSHIMKVACGLDSMVLGEPQILGQMKEAFTESCTANAIGTLFHRLFQQIFSLAKEIRTTTAIGACPVSVASAAVNFAKQQMTDFKNAEVTIIGAGDTSQLLMRYLKMDLAKPITLVNRNIDKASLLAHEFQIKIFPFEQLEAALQHADIVFSATGSANPIVSKDLMMKVMQMRKEKLLTMIDIAVPRDIDACVRELSNIQLFCIDDLKAIIEKNRQGREHAAQKARDIIERKSAEFINEMQTLDKVSHTIRAYRSQIEEICHLELQKAKQQLQQGGKPSEVLESFAYGFTKKLLHTPSVQLRQAGVEGRFELLKFANELFAIPE